MGCGASSQQQAAAPASTAAPLIKAKSIAASSSASAATNTKDFSVPVSRLDSRVLQVQQQHTNPSSSSSATTTTSSSSSSSSSAAAGAAAEDAASEAEAIVKVPRPKDSNAKLSKAQAVPVQSDFASRYELGKMLGKGNYSVVHLATRKQSTTARRSSAPLDDKEVAVKMVNKRGLDDSDVTDIKEEVSILRDLNGHGHIIHLFGLFEDRKFFYIVTEVMAGGELFDEIVEREFYWERDAQEVVKMLADAIGYMHSKGLVHRDLKPENVLLTSKGKDGRVKLADFGFAARTDQIEAYPLNCACGTPGYVAPEIVSGLHYGREVDMWSLGVISFILLGGYPPFHDEDQQELFRMIRRGRYTFDPAFWSLVSEDAKQCVRGMLCVDRTKRFKAKDVLQHAWLADVQQQQQPEGVIADNEMMMLGGGGDASRAGSTLSPLPAPKPSAFLGGGVGGRGMGTDGRGQGESINLTPALRELRKFQARQRWRAGMAMALAREGQVFGADLIQRGPLVLPDENGSGGGGNGDGGGNNAKQPVVYARMTDISLLSGLGTSAVLARLQAEKRQRNNQLNAHF